jgi:hypothetical protein
MHSKQEEDQIQQKSRGAAAEEQAIICCCIVRRSSSLFIMYNIYTDVSFTHLAVAVVVHVHPIVILK